MAKVSRHGFYRIRDRCGVPKKAVKKVIKSVLKNGITHAETTGSLNRYITHLYFYNKSANNIRIFNDKVFIFSGEVLITVLNLPQKYKRIALKIQESKKQDVVL